MKQSKITNSGDVTLINKTTRFVTIIIGTLMAIAGFEHGLFEALQGNKPTDGFAIHGISDSMKWWEHGTEDAVSIVPNYLITGILGMMLSVFIVIWLVKFVHKKNGVLVLLLLFILLTLVGGGVGYIPFFLTTIAYATRINKPLKWWSGLFKNKIGKLFATVWPYSLTITVLCWLITIEIAIFGYFPGQNNPETLLYICWSFLLGAFVFINISFIASFAHDVQKRI